MSLIGHSDRRAHETRLLKIIREIAPDISTQELRKGLAIKVLVFRGRTIEELEHMAKHGYFVNGTPEQQEREREFFRRYPDRPSASFDAGQEPE
jgi:hypothetical protein